jgi:phosphatidate cytidylyltransferase
MVCAATDTAGYAAGKKYGTHAGIFPWSPNKTPQGLIAAWLTGTFVGYLTISWLPTTLVKYPILFSGGAALLAIVGDSIQSILKRNAHIKDAGTLLPGHGGILDRVDSILMVGIAMYLAIRIKLL